MSKTGEFGHNPRFEDFRCEDIERGIILYEDYNANGYLFTNASCWGIIDDSIEPLLYLEKTNTDNSMMVTEQDDTYLIKKSKFTFVQGETGCLLR